MGLDAGCDTIHPPDRRATGSAIDRARGTSEVAANRMLHLGMGPHGHRRVSLIHNTRRGATAPCSAKIDPERTYHPNKNANPSSVRSSLDITIQFEPSTSHCDDRRATNCAMGPSRQRLYHPRNGGSDHSNGSDQTAVRRRRSTRSRSPIPGSEASTMPMRVRAGRLGGLARRRLRSVLRGDGCRGRPEHRHLRAPSARRARPARPRSPRA